MKIKSFSYTFKEAFKNLWRNHMMSIASISSVAATLIILGIIFILIMNINSLTDSVKVQFDTVQVYLDESLDQSVIDDIGDEISAIVGVEEVLFESRGKALENMKDSWEEHAYLLDGLESNPLPDSYIVALQGLVYSEHVVGELKQINGIEEVKYYQDVINKLLEVTQFIRTLGLIIIVVLIAVSTFIMNNTIKLAVNSRRREINIMKYVGATNWFIRWPFLLEGTILGLIGAGIASGVIYVAYKYTFELFTSQFYVIIAAYIVSVNTVMGDLMIIFCVLGAGIGALGSINALRRHLNV